jgi:hypothetical protein
MAACLVTRLPQLDTLSLTPLRDGSPRKTVGDGTTPRHRDPGGIVDGLENGNLKRLVAGLACADSDRLLERRNEDLAVTD